MIRRIFILIYLLLFPISSALGWGFLAHKEINKHAVFTLPPEMFAFYKEHIRFITEKAINPDKRSHIVDGESPRHYIDVEYYDDGVPWRRFKYWSQAVEVCTQETLMQYGVLPWHIYRVKCALTEALRRQDACAILRLSADLGHYIADAHVPLHTSKNYDGQLTGQEGIHGLWETRLPEIFLGNYDFFVGQAAYVPDPQESAWKAIIATHNLVHDVLCLERKLSEGFSAVKKYSFEQRGGTLQKVYSVAYARAYHTLLDGQVEQQVRASIKMVGDFWLTCWIDAGKPDLAALL